MIHAIGKPKSLEQQLTEKFGKVHRSSDGVWFNFPCPTCSPKDRPKAKRFIAVAGAYTSNCFICGITMSIFDLLDGWHIPGKAPEETEDKPDWVDPRALVLPYRKAIPVNQLASDHPAVKFLHKYHLFDLNTYANVHKIVYVPYEGGMMFHNGLKVITSAERLVFPVYFEQKLVGWQMRSLPGTYYGDLPDVVRYYHIFNKGSYLYNYDQAKLCPRVVVVEGVKKALKFGNGVATWGCGLSKTQLTLIQTWPEIVMMLDSDEGNNTQAKAREFVAGFNFNPKCRAINVDLIKYGYKSPDDAPADVLNKIVEDEWNEQNSRRT